MFITRTMFKQLSSNASRALQRHLLKKVWLNSSNIQTKLYLTQPNIYLCCLLTWLLSQAHKSDWRVVLFGTDQFSVAVAEQLRVRGCKSRDSVFIYSRTHSVQHNPVRTHTFLRSQSLCRKKCQQWHSTKKAMPPWCIPCELGRVAIACPRTRGAMVE